MTSRLRARRRARGAALLLAMLVLALVASLASSAFWLQWRQTETEIAERQHQQMRWLMTGALDWVGLILAEDGRSADKVDHLHEPWALPIAPVGLSTFLAPQQQWRQGDPEVYLWGRLHDAQARLNLRNLEAGGTRPEAQTLAALQRLFERLNLPPTELRVLVAPWSDAANGAAPMQPQRPAELHSLGLAETTWTALRPHITVLPEATPVNLNTANEVVLLAVLPGVDPVRLRSALAARQVQPWGDLQAASAALGMPLNPQRHAVQTAHFLLEGGLRMGPHSWEESALFQRQNQTVRLLWRQAGTLLQ